MVEKEIITREAKALEQIHYFEFKLSQLGKAFIMKKITRTQFIGYVEENSKKFANSMNTLYGHPPTQEAEKASLYLSLLVDLADVNGHAFIGLQGAPKNTFVDIGDTYGSCKKITDLPKGVKTTRKHAVLDFEFDLGLLKRLKENAELPPDEA
jgi:hypothetical protein